MKFPRQTPHVVESKRHLAAWLLLTGAAGTVNGFAFMACKQFVTHLSGAFSQLGLESHHTSVLVDSAALVLSFIAGAASSVFLVQPRPGKRQSLLPLMCVSLLLVTVAVIGKSGAFGPFGGVAGHRLPTVALLSILAFAMGLQNAVVAVTTGLAVRTTHVTGPATDLGIQLGTAALASGSERQLAIREALLRAGKILAFAVGAGLMVPLTVSFEYLSLVAPAMCIALANVLSTGVDDCFGTALDPSWA
jgi:uncharacterized membrane protein YoaK (UPF0700 family)